MKMQLLLIVVCDDRPGIVEKIAETVHSNNGNWLESRLSRLGGKFTGIVQVEIDSEHEPTLTHQLFALKAAGILITVEPIENETSNDRSEKQTQNDKNNAVTSYSFSIAGNDRTGIIKEVSQAFSVRRINLENLSSRCTSMPHSGTPLFEAEGIISVLGSIDIDELSKQLDRISDELAIDIQLEEFGS